MNNIEELEEVIIDMNTIDDVLFEIPECPKKTVPEVKENPKIDFKIEKWELPREHKSLTIVCVGRNMTGKSYLASKICENVYDPSMNFYYIYGQDHNSICYDIFNKAEHIPYFDASNNDNADKISGLELEGKINIIVAEQLWDRTNYSKSIHDSLCDLFFKTKKRPENTLYIQAIESDSMYRARAEDIDYLILNRAIYDARLREIYRQLGLWRLFKSYRFFSILYLKITCSQSHAKMVIYLSTTTSDINKYVSYSYFEDECSDSDSDMGGCPQCDEYERYEKSILRFSLNKSILNDD